jgi:hypothetical protein
MRIELPALFAVVSHSKYLFGDKQTMEDQFANAIGVLGVYFALMAGLAIAVETVIGWLKLPVKQLQGKPSPEEVMKQMKTWLTEEEFEAQNGRIEALKKALAELGETQKANEIKADADGNQIAQWANDALTIYVKKKRDRRAVIRLLTIILGIVFAFFFQINTVQLLLPIFSEAYQQTVLNNLGGLAIVIGIVLSGLAASAGSSYWHDQSARLRNLKNTSSSIKDLLGSGS